MNATIETITSHRSIRSYTSQDVDDSLLAPVLRAAQAMPSSINGQQVSVIVVRDAARRSRIAEIAGGQPWIAAAPVFLVFVMDFHKTALAGRKAGMEQVIHGSAEGTVVATFDAGLAMGGAIIAAESLGLGIVPIGGIRRDPQAMVELLGLPEFTYPVAGLVVGHPAHPSAQKPRMDHTAFVHQETYDREAAGRAVDDYDRTMADYYRARGDKATDWSTQIASTYKQVYFPKVHPTLAAQGFTNDK